MIESTRQLRRSQVLHAIGLCGLFLLVYGGTNAFTSTRSDVGSFYYEWERHIPFLPIFVIPYMSIDLFFVAAPFLCASRVELKHFRRQISSAIVIAGILFLVWPLKFSFDRPAVDGWIGLIFNPFREMDKPFNQFPSLHIALRTILADLYFRKTRGPLRWSIAVWFCLIGFSTVFTYQHHVIDIVGGFCLGILCLYVFHDAPWRMQRSGNRTVAFIIGIALLALVVLAIFLPGARVLLIPSVIVTGLLTLAYLGVGPAIFRKSNGRLHWTAKCMFLPYLIGQKISRDHYARRSPPWNELTDRVFIGRHLTDAEASELVQRGVKTVIDLTGEFDAPDAFREITYHNPQVMDLTAPGCDELIEIASTVEQAAQRGMVYIHCKAGYSRTAAAAGAYLLISRTCQTADDALARLRTARPGMIIRPEVEAALRNFPSPVDNRPISR